MTHTPQSAHTARQSPATGDRRQFVTFALNSQHYCVDIMSVREIRMLQAITSLPGAPGYVRGIINLRGAIVPIYDPRLRFGIGHTAIVPNHAVIVVSARDQLMGLLVDEVLDIVAVDGGGIASVPDTDTSRRNPFFEGLITVNEEMLIVVDLERLSEATPHFDFAADTAA